MTVVTPLRRPACPRIAAGQSAPLTLEQSIAHLERSYGGLLRRYLTALTGDPQRAEDIYQETLIRAWKHPEERDTKGHYGRPWLFTVARRISIDQLRAAAIRPIMVSDEEVPVSHGNPDETDSVIAAHEVWKALGVLTAEHRKIIYERYFLDRPTKEIAERMGVPVGTVKSRVHHAVRALRNVLTEREFAVA